LVTMTFVFELPYCNVYGTGYQLRYVYRNNGSGIAVEYITGTSNLLSNLRSSHTAAVQRCCRPPLPTIAAVHSRPPLPPSDLRNPPNTVALQCQRVGHLKGSHGGGEEGWPVVAVMLALGVVVLRSWEGLGKKLTSLFSFLEIFN
jgi:hypothetical protein